MTSEEKARKIKVVNARAKLAREIAELRERLTEVASGVSSASLSSGIGSKSYSNFSPETIRAEICAKQEEYDALGRILTGAPRIKHVVTIRS